ncbi:MAG TPA: hypothetical protein VK775_19695 [Chthoniobacterales bacterium]|jgi:hypothetical protein|nr:hypothetical protein [Chthoniobacterales bacterium]
MAVIGLLANLDIGLIPSQTEASREIGVLGAIGLKEAVLDGEVQGRVAPESEAHNGRRWRMW